MNTVTLTDIARKAKVSPSTVSLVVNDRDGVHPETRRRVSQVIDALGYRTRSVSREAPRAEQPHKIALAYPALSTHSGGQVAQLPSMLLSGARQELKHHPCSFSLLAGFPHVDQDDIFRSMVDEGQIEGAIFVRVAREDGYIQYLIDRNIPVVAIGNHSPEGLFSSVEPNNWEGGRLAARFFVERGHRRLAVVGDSKRRITMARRAMGFVQEARSLNAQVVTEVDARACFEASSSEDEAYQRMVQPLLEHEATGIFFVMDNHAAGCAGILGDRVPDPIEIIGFDNLGRYASDGKRVSSVHWDKHEAGAMAVRVLMQLLDKDSQLSQVDMTVKVNIQEHQTTK